MANLALNGRSMDNLEEVASNFFDPEILDAYRSGLLHEWLIEYGYDSEASQIEKLEDREDAAVLDGIIAALNLDMEMVKMAREARIAAAKAEKEAKEELCESVSVEIAERTIKAESAESPCDLKSACVIDYKDESQVLEVVKRFLARKWGCRGLPPEVFRMLKKAASYYNVEALVLLGRFYENRWNIRKAVRCYHWADLHGSVEGDENLVRCCENGIKLPPQWKQARTMVRDGGGYSIDSNKCVECGCCEDECPVGAIQMKGSLYVIDRDSCVCCGACVSSCPVEAITSK